MMIMQEVNLKKTLLKQEIIKMIFFIMPLVELQKLELAKVYSLEKIKVLFITFIMAKENLEMKLKFIKAIQISSI